MNLNRKSILLLESDRESADAIVLEFEKTTEYSVFVAHTPAEAMRLADSERIDMVVVEIVLNGHSGIEFLYEFRSYPDWQAIPCLIYTTIKVPDAILSSRDWKLLDARYCYKPEVRIVKLREIASEVIGL